LSPPLRSANAASFSGLRPSNTDSGISRSPLASGRPPSPRIASNAFRCWVEPRRPVAPSTTMPIFWLGIRPPQKKPLTTKGHEGTTKDTKRLCIHCVLRPFLRVLCGECFLYSLSYRGGDRFAQDLRDL